jgi:hypothetical protein
VNQESVLQLNFHSLKQRAQESPLYRTTYKSA